MVSNERGFCRPTFVLKHSVCNFHPETADSHHFHALSFFRATKDKEEV